TESRGSESGGRAFLGFEVKYHETLGGKPGKHRARYDEVADAMKVFVPARDALRKNPLQQIWCDHLLAGSMLLADPEWTSGASVLLYPKDDPQCADAIARYRRHLVSAETFDRPSSTHSVPRPTPRGCRRSTSATSTSRRSTKPSPRGARD